MEAVTPRTGLLSVVLPAYNEEESVPLAARTIGGLLAEADIPYELLFVNDGSRDHTWLAIQKAAEQDPRVRGIRFSRNFGKEAAIFAGLAQARGACCVVLDCDLQHPPEKILEAGWLAGGGGRQDQPRPGKSRPHLCRPDLLPLSQRGHPHRYVPRL